MLLVTLSILCARQSLKFSNTCKFIFNQQQLLIMMTINRFLFFFSITLFGISAHLYAREKGEPSLEALYEQFQISRVNQDYTKAISLGEQILPKRSELSEKRALVFTYTLAKLYEDNDMMKKGVPLYKEVIAKEPNYYVPHFIYERKQ